MHTKQFTSDIFFQPVKIKDCNVMIDGKNFFDQLVFRKNLTGQGVDYTTDSLLHYVYFKTYYEIIVIDSCKQQTRNTDQKAIQQINFTGNLDRAGNTTVFFITEEAKEKMVLK